MEQNLTDAAKKRLARAAENYRSVRRKNGLTDLRCFFGRFPILHLWRKILSVFRKFRLLSFLIQTAAQIILFIQSGAALILSFFAVTIPLFLFCAVFLFTLPALTIAFRRADRKMKTRLPGKRVYLLFADSDSGFLSGFAASLAENDGNAVFIVPRYFSIRFSSAGGKLPFFAIRHTKNGVYCIRRLYYFHLRKRLPDPSLCRYCY